ncbi:MAG: DUF2723 domain-containing protein [Pseudobdellovibrionaceae bacterium]
MLYLERPVKYSFEMPILLSLFFFALFAFQTTEDVGQGPSSVISTLLSSGGIPTPPGYPLYTLLADLSLLIPFGTPLWRMNFLQAILGALVCWALYDLFIVVCKGLRLDKIYSKAIGLTLIVAFAGVESFQRNIYWTDRYIAALLFYILFLNYTIRILRNEATPRKLFAYGFFAGLCLCAHLSLALLVGVLGLAVLWNQKKKAPAFAILSLSGLMGLMPFLYLPIKSRSNPFFDWGDPEAWVGFKNMITRFEAGPLPWVHNLNELSQSLELHLRLSLDQINIFFFFGFAALAVLWRKNRKLGVIFLTCLLLSGFYISLAVFFPRAQKSDLHLEYLNWLMKNYFLFYWTLLFLLAGIGIVSGLEFLQSKWKPFAIALACLFSIGTGYSSVRSYLSRASAPAVSRVLISTYENKFDPGSLVLINIDSIYFPFMYAQLIEGKFKDVVFIHMDSLFRHWYWNSLRTHYKNFALFESPRIAEFQTVMRAFEAAPEKADHQRTLQAYFKIVDWLVSEQDSTFRPIYIIDFPELGLGEVGVFANYHVIPQGLYNRISRNALELTATPLDSSLIQMWKNKASSPYFWDKAWVSYLKMMSLKTANYFQAIDPAIASQFEEMSQQLSSR